MILSSTATTLWQFLNSSFNVDLQTRGMSINADTYSMNVKNNCLVTCYNNVISKYMIVPSLFVIAPSNVTNIANITNNSSNSSAYDNNTGNNSSTIFYNSTPGGCPNS